MALPLISLMQTKAEQSNIHDAIISSLTSLLQKFTVVEFKAISLQLLQNWLHNQHIFAPHSPKSPSNPVIFQRLYDEAKYKKQRQYAQTSEKTQKDLEPCTFKPKVNEKYPSIVESVFERLSNPRCQTRAMLHNEIKEQKELEFCTFSPSVPRAQRRNKESDVYNNLYTQAFAQIESLEQKSKVRQQQSMQHELDECTFSPKTNTSVMSSMSERHTMSKRDILNDMEKLYKNHEQTENKKEVMRSTILVNQMKISPFHPQINSNHTSMNSNGEPRYEGLFKDHEKKQRAIEKKKLEDDMQRAKNTRFKAKVPTYLRSQKKQFY